MSKFHVGDRVRINQEGYAGHGAIGTVTNVDDDHVTDHYPYRVQFDQYMDHLGNDDIFEEIHLRPADIVALPIQKAVDVVNHPPHYNRFPVEVINITEQLDFNRGNAVKYLARAGSKEGVDELEDLSKAAWYVNRAIEKLTKERENA